MIQSRDTDCMKDIVVPQYQEIYNFLYTDYPQDFNIPAVMCCSWIKRKVIKTGWFGDTEILFSVIPRDMSLEECFEYKQTKKCHENYMTQRSEKIWSYDNDAIGGSKWGQTSVVEVINCAIEYVNITRSCDLCDFKTPLGKVIRQANYVSRKHFIVL